MPGTSGFAVAAAAVGALLLALGAPGVSANAPGSCGAKAPAAVQVLGSGGPMHGGGRASASYLLWRNGRPSILVDAGGGASVALARAGADASDLDAILITHLHPDHVSDLPDLIWGVSTENQGRTLEIAGPSGGGAHPGLDAFLTRLFGPDGAYPFMTDVLGQPHPLLKAVEVDASVRAAADVFTVDGATVRAYAVAHGKTPALAYRVDGPGFSVVFGGDQTARDPGFSRFASGADLLILHAILNPSAKGAQLADVVALPADLATTAAEARPKALVLGHLMGQSKPGAQRALWSLDNLASVSAAVHARYRGPIRVASDLACYPLGTSARSH